MRREIALQPIPIDAESFAVFGQVIAPARTARRSAARDAQLSNGTPRLYIMRL